MAYSMQHLMVEPIQCNPVAQMQESYVKQKMHGGKHLSFELCGHPKIKSLESKGRFLHVN